MTGFLMWTVLIHVVITSRHRPLSDPMALGRGREGADRCNVAGCQDAADDRS